MDPFWTRTADGELLRAILGDYPSLADARVRRIEFVRDGREVRMEVDHRDDAGSVRLKFVWQGVERCDLVLDGEPRLYGMEVSHRDGLYRCDLIQGMSLYGRIEAESFDVHLLKADPGEDDAPLEIGYV